MCLACGYGLFTVGEQGIAERHLTGQMFGVGVVVEAKGKRCLPPVQRFEKQWIVLWNIICKNPDDDHV